MFSCEFATSFFKEHLWTKHVKALYTTEQLFQIISWIDRKTPVIEPFILSLQARRPAILIKKLNQVCFPEKYFRRALLRALIANTGWSFNLLGHIFFESCSVFLSSVFVFSCRICCSHFFSCHGRLFSLAVRFIFLLLASFLYVETNYTTISRNVPIRIKSWLNDKLTADSSSNGTKWSAKFTNKSSWRTLCLKREASKLRKVKSCSMLICIKYTLTDAS